MKKIIKFTVVFLMLLGLANCEDYLNTSSPSNTDDEFVTSTVKETAKTLSWAYARYRQSCLMGTYAWNDVISSDAEYYPEANSSNNVNARLKPEQLTVNAVSGGFDALYSVISRTSQVAELIAAKDAYKNDVAAGKTSDWTQLYGEAITLRALAYFDLTKHFGDVPYGYENQYVDEYELNSRFDIYDNLIETLKAVEPLMYNIGEGGITAEKMSRTFANALIGQIALFSGGYQTIRTDMPELYGSVQFTEKGKRENGAVYARRSDYLEYYKIAEQYFNAALTTNKGTVRLITTDERSYSNNPFQRHFQYLHDLQVSPESLYEAGVYQGNTGSGSQTNEFGYGFGRPSSGGSSNAAPPKVFAAIRVVPTFYYGEWTEGDKRRDVSVTVTGSRGDGNEMLIPFTPANMANGGGISINKWDVNRMNPPFTTSQRQTGINWLIMRVADVILMQAEVKAELNKNEESLALVNQIRERAFGNSSNNLSGLSGEALKNAILKERKLEFVGEGQLRWDLVRSGKYSEAAIDVRNAMQTMVQGLTANGYYEFANGNVISNYIWTKMVKLQNPLTFDADKSNPALYPGWRGQYDYSTTPVANKVVGTDHNLAIEGLFEYIAPNSTKAQSLESQGYVRTDWANKLVDNAAAYYENILSGISSSDTPPRYYWPIPYETLTMSKGKITNGYGLPQQ